MPAHPDADHSEPTISGTAITLAALRIAAMAIVLGLLAAMVAGALTLIVGGGVVLATIAGLVSLFVVGKTANDRLTTRAIARAPFASDQ